MTFTLAKVAKSDSNSTTVNSPHSDENMRLIPQINLKSFLFAPIYVQKCFLTVI